MDKEIHYMFKTITEIMQRKANLVLRELDITFVQARVLFLISLKSGQITQKEVEEKMMISHAATHGILKRLNEKGYIEIMQNEIDKRNKVLVITPLGQEKKEVLEKIKGMDQPLKALDEEDVIQLKRILNKIISYIKEN